MNNNERKRCFSYTYLFAPFKSYFFLGVLVLALLVWFIGPVIDAVILNGGTLYQHLFQSNSHELFIRSYASLSMIIFGYTASILLNRSRQSEVAFIENESMYRTLFDKSADASLIIEGKQFVDCNQATASMLGFNNKNDVLMAHPSKLSPEKQADGRSSLEKANEMMQIAFERGSHRFEWNHRRCDGEVFPVEVLLTSIPFEKTEILHVVWRDITERKHANELLTYQACHDALTGLVNRREFERRLECLLSTVKQDNSEHALCYIDLDQFKVVNDTGGHMAGDEMLRQISSLLTNCLRRGDTIARLGGDEFGVLIAHSSFENACRIATALHEAIQNYCLLWGEHRFKVGASMGVVAIVGTSENLSTLLNDADEACYIAKNSGRNRIQIYDIKDIKIIHHHDEMQWVTRLNQALAEESYSLYAQTIQPLDGSADKHYEFLIRLINEKGEVITPDAFLPAAEHYGLISKIDRWVIKKTFGLLKQHPAFLKRVSFCSINLSGQSVTDHFMLDFIMSQFDETGIAGEKICFEITETAAIANLSTALKFMSALKAIGCRFALDDFGSGLSSFGYLKDLPVDYLKIDGIFVKDIVDDPINHAMVKSINDIGQVMGMQTIAEFVENDEIKGMLREIGVNYIQGYAIDTPQPFDKLLSSYVTH